MRVKTGRKCIKNINSCHIIILLHCLKYIDPAIATILFKIGSCFQIKNYVLTHLTTKCVSFELKKKNLIKMLFFLKLNFKYIATKQWRVLPRWMLPARSKYVPRSYVRSRYKFVLNLADEQKSFDRVRRPTRCIREQRFPGKRLSPN